MALHHVQSQRIQLFRTALREFFATFSTVYKLELPQVDLREFRSPGVQGRRIELPQVGYGNFLKKVS